MLIAEHGPQATRWLRAELGVRMSTVLDGLHVGPFVQVGKGRAARWDVAPAAVTTYVISESSERYRLEVWKACRSGAIDALEAIELLIEPKPRVLELLAEAAT